jgi:tetratricopeptide (TPR) repeat protein
MQNEIDKLFEEGVYLYEQGKMDDAETKFLEALRLDNSSDDIKYNLALVYLEKKEYNKTNFLISQIKEIDCDEILDELEKVDFEVQHENPFKNIDQTKIDLIDQQINYYIDILKNEYLPNILTCEFCETEIELSEIEKQNKYYTCPKCKKENNIREKERALENEFKNKPDSELFEIIIDSVNFRIEFVQAAKREIVRRNINLTSNDDFKSILINTLK